MLTNVNDLITLAAQPDELKYEVLEYITLNGTQYFNTGVVGDNNTNIELGFNPAIIENFMLCGARNAASSNNISAFMATYTSPPALYLDFNNSNYATYRCSIPIGSFSVNTWYDLILKKNERALFTNGQNISKCNAINNDVFSSTLLIYLGSVNGLNIDGQIFNKFSGSIRYFKITGHDYIPVLDGKNRPCLFDKITQTFLYAQKNDGSIAYDLGYKKI